VPVAIIVTLRGRCLSPRHHPFFPPVIDPNATLLHLLRHIFLPPGFWRSFLPTAPFRVQPFISSPPDVVNMRSSCKLTVGQQESFFFLFPSRVAKIWPPLLFPCVYHDILAHCPVLTINPFHQAAVLSHGISDWIVRNPSLRCLPCFFLAKQQSLRDASGKSFRNRSCFFFRPIQLHRYSLLAGHFCPYTFSLFQRSFRAGFPFVSSRLVAAARQKLPGTGRSFVLRQLFSPDLAPSVKRRAVSRGTASLSRPSLPSSRLNFFLEQSRRAYFRQRLGSISRKDFGTRGTFLL